MKKDVEKKIDTLKEKSIRIYNGMIIFTANFSRAAIRLSDISAINDCYAVENSVVCFVHEGEMFVTPDVKTTKALKELGFKENSNVPVMFCNGDYPKCEKNKWDDLCEKSGRFTYA